MNTFDHIEFIKTLDKKYQDEINKMSKLSYKYDDNNKLLLLFDDEFKNSLSDYQYKNFIFDVETKKLIASQYNQIIIGYDNIKKNIDNNNYEHIYTRNCYEGTHLTVFNHKDKWIITTKKCLDANESRWNNNKSHGEMFNEVVGNYFDINSLNKNYVYHFNLIHYDNFRNIVFNGENSKMMLLDLLFISEKETLKTLPLTPEYAGNELLEFILDDESIGKSEIKGTTDEIINSLKNKSDELDRFTKDNKGDNVYLNREGLIVEMYNNGIPTLCKIQTPLYEFIYKHPAPKYNLNYPKYDILYMKFILDKSAELKLPSTILQQKLVKSEECPNGKFVNINYDLKDDEEEINKLINYYFTPEQINTAMINIHYNLKNIAYLTKDVYFTFLENRPIYEQLPDCYKVIKYLIHGVYKSKTENMVVNEGEKYVITSDIIYNYLINYNMHIIKELLLDYSLTTKILHQIWGKDAHNYNRVQYPAYIMKKQIKSKFNKSFKNNKNNKKEDNKKKQYNKNDNEARNIRRNQRQGKF